MLKKTSQSQKRTEEVKYHFLFVEVPIAVVAEEIIRWGEASWWPKKCLMQYKRETEGPVKVGTRYRLRIRKPLTPTWIVEVTRFIPNELIERTFKNGMFAGYELIRVEERANGTRIDYELHFRIRGLLNKILWPMLYRKQHDGDLEMIMSSLKEHLNQRHQREQERRLEGK